MTPDTLARARWRQRDIAAPALGADYYLVARTQDGGHVLATIFSLHDRGGYLGCYAWKAGEQVGTADTIGKAQRDARQALREVGV